ncbi:MAG: alanyl-tRNA editing protein [Candidatus Hodarchaeales archaeon]
MTKRMYLVDNYVKDFRSTLIKTDTEGLVLKETYFYPEGGGQPGDKGTLFINDQAVKVKNTRIKQGEIIHETDTLDFPVGAEVEGKIDWKYRNILMRSHSAQHVLSRYFQVNYQAETVSTQLKAAKSRIDFQPLGKITPEELEKIANDINMILAKNLPISIKTLPREEAFSYLREKKYQTKYLEMVPKSIKSIRIISIGEYDFAACAGTHLNNTSEIGKISLISTKNKGKLRERIFYSVS